MTDENRNAELVSIVRERERYRELGDEDNVKHCDEVLARLGPQRTPPARATRKREA